MDRNYSKLFSEFNDKSAPPDLLGKILFRIGEEKEKQANRKRFIVSFGVMLFSLAVIIPAFIQLVNNLASSGFGQLVSLIFSDFSLVAAHYQDFLLSLLEAVPMFTISLIFVGFFALIEAFRIWAKGAGNINYKFRV